MASSAGDSRRVKLLLDEMHSPDVAEMLVTSGYDVLSIGGEPSWKGRSDDDVFAFAASNDRALVTENIKDLIPAAADWLAAGGVHAGLLLTPARRFDRHAAWYRSTLAEALRQFLDDPPVAGDSWIYWLAAPTG